MKEMYKEWSTVIKEFWVHDIISNTRKTFPYGTKLEWQRVESQKEFYIQIMSDNYADSISCGNFDIEKYLVRDKLIKQMDKLAEETAEEVKRCEDSFEITEPTELQKEQARKIMGQETRTEVIINYLKCSIEKCSDKHVLDWLNEELKGKQHWLDTINFCNTSDKEIISEALIAFSNKYRAEGKLTEANKIDTVMKNYLDSFAETKEAE